MFCKMNTKRRKCTNATATAKYETPSLFQRAAAKYRLLGKK